MRTALLTTTTVTTVTTPTTTTTSTTTGGGNIALGRHDYDNRCSSCHAAGAHDPNGFAGDLAGKGDNLVPDLGTIDGDMDGILLSDSQLANMAAFLDSLK